MKMGVVGCAGRMGRMLISKILETDGAELAGGTEQPGTEALGADVAGLAGAAPSGLVVGDDASELFAKSDVVIDFTAPAATVAHAGLAIESSTALIVGTTGLSDDDLAVLKQAGGSVPIVQAGNMSLGINLLLGLTEQVARALGEDFDIEVLEMHHRHKVDAPSGTALMLGEAAATGRDVELAAVSERVRDGHTGARTPGDIGFATLRGGDVIGEHSVMFAGPGERIEITHKAADRGLFANGAVKAALWTAGKAPGFYSMRDVLGLV